MPCRLFKPIHSSTVMQQMRCLCNWLTACIFVMSADVLGALSCLAFLFVMYSMVHMTHTAAQRASSAAMRWRWGALKNSSTLNCFHHYVLAMSVICPNMWLLQSHIALWIARAGCTSCFMARYSFGRCSRWPGSFRSYTLTWTHRVTRASMSHQTCVLR